MIFLRSTSDHITDLLKPINDTIALSLKLRCYKTLQGPMWLVMPCLPIVVPQHHLLSMDSPLSAIFFSSPSHFLSQHLHTLQDPTSIELPPELVPLWSDPTASWRIVRCFSWQRILYTCLFSSPALARELCEGMWEFNSPHCITVFMHSWFIFITNFASLHMHCSILHNVGYKVQTD